MMKFESNRMKVAEQAYTNAVMKIKEDQIDLYFQISKWYDQICSGNMTNFRRFMAACNSI